MSDLKTTFRGRLTPASGVIVAVLFCGLAISHRQILFTSSPLVHGGGADPVLVNYILEHQYRWITRTPGHSSLWNPPYFTPHRNVAAYTELFLGIQPFYAVERVVGMSPATAHRFLPLMLSSANFVAMLLLLRAMFGLSLLPSLAGSYLFAFAAPRMNQLDHLQLFPAFYVVLSVAGLIRLIRLPVPGDSKEIGLANAWPGIAMLFGGLVLQFWTSFYFFWFLSFSYCLFGLVVLCHKAWWDRLMRWLRLYGIRAGAGLVVAGLMIYPALRHYLLAAKETGTYPFREIVYYAPHIGAWIYAGAESAIYGWMSEIPRVAHFPAMGEKRLGVGLVTLGLVIAGFWIGRRRSLVGPAALLCGFVVASLISWPLGWPLWGVVFDMVPGAPAIRAISRWGVFLLLFYALALALSLQAIWSIRRGVRFWRGLAIGLAVFCGVEQITRTNTMPLQQAHEEAAAFAAKFDPASKHFLFTVTTAEEFNPGEVLYWQSKAMLMQLYSGRPTLNGYSGRFPPNYWLGDIHIQNCWDYGRVYKAMRVWATMHPNQLGSVSWIRYSPPGTKTPYTGVSVVNPAGLQDSRDRVIQVYLDVAGRMPREGEVEPWVEREHLGELVAKLIASEEFQQNQWLVEAAYRAVLGRQADYGGWSFYTEEQLQGVHSQEELIRVLLDSEERKNLKSKPGVDSSDPAEIIQRIHSKDFQLEYGKRILSAILFKTLLRRGQEPEAMEAILESFNHGESVAAVADAILSSEEYEKAMTAH